MDFSQFDLTDPFVRRALAETLAEDNGLDYQDEYIRKALNDEISAAAQAKPIDGERNFFGDTVSRLARGGVQLADTALHAVDTAVGGSETLQGWSDSLDKAKQNVGLLRPDKSEHEEGWLKRSYGQALESAPMSAVPWAGAMAGAKAGAALGTSVFPGVGTAAGLFAGGLIGGTLAMGGLFGLGTYGQRKEEIERELTATRPDLTPDEISKMAHDNAKSHAFAETGFESAGDLASWAILSKVPGGQAIFKGGKAVLAELVKPNAFKAIALGIGKSMPFEVGSEVGTAIWQNEADKAIGVEQGASTDAALAAIGPALFLSAGMGVAVGGYSANQRRVQYNALNSEDQDSRAQAVDQVASTLAEATDQQTAKKWRDMALGFVQNNQPIPLDMNLAELSANEPESAIHEAQDQPAETILKAESVDEAIQEAEAEISRPGWLAPTAPDLEESAWLQQGAASKAYNQGRNELGATPVSRAGLLGQAMEPMQVAPPADPLTEILSTISTTDQPALLQMADGLPGLVEGSPELAPYQRQLSEAITARQRVLWEDSNVGRGTVSGDSGAPQGQPEQPAGVRDIEPIRGDSGRQGDGESSEGGSGTTQEAPLLTAARQHVAETGDMTMGGLAMALDVDIDTAADLLEQVKAATPLPRNIAGTQAATRGADTGGFLNEQAIRKAGATSTATTAGDAQGFIADQGIRKATGTATAATGADTEGFVRDQQIRRDAMARGPKPTRAADEPARAFLARKREWEASASQSGENETQAELPRTDETQTGARGGGEGEYDYDLGAVWRGRAPQVATPTVLKSAGGGKEYALPGMEELRVIVRPPSGNKAKRTKMGWSVYVGDNLIWANLPGVADTAENAISTARGKLKRIHAAIAKDQAHTTPKTTSTAHQPSVEGVTAPSPGEASNVAAEMKKLVASIKKSDAKLEKLHEGQLARMKNGGQSRATSTTYAARSGNEAKHRDGEARVLANIARAELRDGRAVPQDVLDILGSKIEYNRSGDYEPIASNAKPQQSADMADVPETDFGNIKKGEIYPTTVGGKEMYAIRGDNPRGGGDSLFGTREEAQTEVERAAKVKAANEKSRADVKESPAEEVRPVRGTIAERRADAILDKTNKLDGFGLETRRELMEKVAKGEIPWRVEMDEVEDHAARKKDEAIVDRVRSKYILSPKDRTRGSNPNIPEVKSAYDAIDRLVAGYKKARYRLVNTERGNFYNISKTEYDYAKSLEADAAQPSASKATPEKPLLDEFTEGHLKKWVEDKIIPEDQDRYLAGIKAYLADHKEVIDRGHSWSKIRDLAEQWNYIKQPPTTPQQDRTPEKPAGVATSGQRQEQAKLLTKAQFNDEAQQYANFGKYSYAVASDESPIGIALRQDIRTAIEAYRDDFREKARQVENKLRKWFDIPEGDIKDEIDKAVIALLNGESAAGGGHLHINGGKLFAGRGTRAEQSAKKIANANGTSVVFGYTDNAVAGAEVDDGDFIIELPFDMSDYGKGDGRRLPFLLSSNFRLSGDWAYTPKQPWATRGKPPLIGEYSDFMSKQERAAKEPWQMTSDEFSAQELEADEYRDQIEGSAEDLRDFRQNTDLAWRRSVESRAEVGRVPDAVLDDYIEKYGEDTFSSMFRGVAEKGRAGYVLPKNRGQEGFTPVAKKYVSDLKPHERTWDQQRTAIKQGMPRKLSLAEWKEERANHKSAVQKALRKGEKVPASVLAEYPELADAKPRKDEDTADIAEPTQGTPKWAEEHATAVGGRVVYHDKETALVEGYSLLTGEPIHAGVLKSSGSRTRVNIAKYTGKMFTDEQKQNLIKQSGRVRAEEQRLHEENPDGPFVGGQRVAASEHIPEWVSETVREWTALLGIKRRIYITTIEDAKREKFHGPFGAIRSASLTSENQRGTHRQLSNGDSYLVLRPGGQKTLLLEVMGHEIGHILEKEAWADAPEDLKVAVERDFNEWRNRRGIPGREWVNSMRAMRTARKTDVAAGVTSDTMPPYWKSFSEYFADQTARWAMTSEKPRSVVERFFKRIADKLKQLYAAVAGQKYLPSESMRAYLDSRTDAALTVRQVSVEVSAEPAQPDAASGEQGKEAARKVSAQSPREKDAETASSEAGKEDDYKPASALTREEYAAMLKNEGVGPKNKDVIRQSQDIAILRELFEDEIKEDSFARGIYRKIQDLQSGMLRNGMKMKVADEGAFNSVERGIKELFERAVSEGKAVPEMILAENADLAPKEANKYEGFTFSKDDVSLEAATRAHQATSFSPDKRGQQEQESYAGHMRNVLDSLLPLAKTDEQKAELREWFNDYYRPGYLKRLSAQLSAASRTMSAMITGPAKFPTRRNQKALDAESKRMSELVEWSKKSFAKMRAKLNGSEAISSTDVDAKAKLEKKLASLVESQEMMKTANKIIKDKKLDEQGKVDAIMAAGLSEKAARAVLTAPDFMGRIGFAPHSLQNNNAEIRRIKERIAELDDREQKAEETGGSVEMEFEGGRVELNYEDGYIRIFHNAKPDKETREKLKSNGFRWTPSETAWRRKLTLNGKYAAEQVTGVQFSEAEQSEPAEATEAPKLSTALPTASRADIPGELAQAFGKLRARVLMRKITVLESQEDIKALAAKLSPDGMYSEDGTVIQAFAHNGHVYMAADAIEKGHTIPVLKHEFAHIARLGLRGTKPWQALLRSVDERMDENSATGKALREARKKVPADTDADLIAEETLSYAVELSPEVGLVRRAIAMVKRFLVDMGVSPNIFTVEDWSALAAATLRGQARVAMGEQIAYSVRESIRQAKAFFSKLQQVSDDKFGGMKAQSVEPFLLKQGVKKTEIEATGLREWLAAMKPTDKVTKEQLRDFVRANTVEFEDVVLGESGNSVDRAVNERVDSDIDAMVDDIYNDYWYEEVRRAEKEEGVDINDMDRSELEEFFDRMMPRGARISAVRSDYGREMEERAREEITESRQYNDNDDATHFDTYTEPGAKDGSYREMFVTAPGTMPAVKDRMGTYDVIGADGEHIATWSGRNKREIEDEVKDRVAAFPVYRGATVVEVESPATHRANWKDGHSQYSEIKNPIVRIRFNEVTGPNGERILRVEEMQGPSDENQKGMPKYLRDNIYQTGVKRILAYAKENGFDGVALATKPGRTAGETQADRYSLEKHIERIEWSGNKGDRTWAATKGDEIVADGLESEAEAYLGKDIARRIAEADGLNGEIVGLDLRVGGTGLRQLYDTDLPNIFKAWGGAKMGEIGGSRVSGTSRRDRFEIVGPSGEVVDTVQTEMIAKAVARDKGAGYSVRDTGATAKALTMPYIPVAKAASSYPMFSQRQPSERIRYSKQFNDGEVEAAMQVKSALKKNDLKWWERVFKTFDYLSRIDPAAKRIFQYGAEDRRENKVRLEDRILDNIAVPDGAYIDPQYSEKKEAGFVSFLTNLQKKDNATYTAANDYLLTVDRTGKAFSVKRQEGYTVKSPDGEVLATGLRTKEDGYTVIRDHHAANYGKDSDVLKKDYSNDKQSSWVVTNPKGAILSEHDTETEAVAARRDAEAGKMRADGKEEKTIAAVMQFREMTDRAFDLMAGDLRRVIDEAERLGLDEPTMEVVDERKRYVILDAQGNKVPESYYENRKDAELFAKSISHKGRFQVKKQADNEILMPMTLSAAISQMGDLRGSYFPRQRQTGAVVLTATKEGSNIRKNFDLYMLGGERTDIETGEVLTESKIKTFLRDRANLVTPLGLEMARLKADGYTVKVAPADRMPETVFEATQLFASINALIEDAAKGVKKDADPNLQRAYNELAKTLTMNIADTFKQRGYLSSRMKRTQDYWEGFETDMLKAGVQYAKGMAGGLAKREAAQKMTLALTGRETTFAEYQSQNPGARWEDYQQFVRDNAIDPKTQPRLLEETKSWMQEMLRNDEQADRILGTIKGLAVLKFLGFRVSSAAVNMTNMVQAVPATIAAQTGTSISRALGQVGSSARLYKQYRTGKAEQADKEIFTEISERGWDNPQFNHEAAAVLRSKAGNWFAKFTDAAMWMFGQAEKVNRAVTIHAAYMQAKRMSPDLGHVGWMNKAKQISDDAHGVYGKETAPAWTRGAYNPLKLSYTFQRFMHNYFLNMGQMWERGKYKELTWMLISPALIAGPGATLLTPIAASMLGALGIGGDDPEEEFYTWAEQTFGEGSTGARVARHGFSGALGVNLKGSIEMGFAMPTTVAELFGAPGSLVTDAVDSVRAFGKGEVSKGFEKALPTGMGTMLKANREQREGITTGGYSPIWYGDEPLKTTGGGSVARFFGFNPSVISGVREKLWSEKRIEQKYASERKRINDRIRRLVLQNGGRIPREDMDEIRGEVARYNERARGLSIPGVPLIKTSTIRQAIRSAKRPPRKERLRTNPNI